MKLTKLVIKRLYSQYDYNVEFNSDVTFLFGSNGCGKTTILNITEGIITGRIYKLFDYDFEEITLYYSPTKKPEEKNIVSIKKANNELTIEFNKQKYTLNEKDYDRACEIADHYEEVYRILETGNEFLSKIRKTFNYVYLPLSRSTSIIPNHALRRMLLKHRGYRYSYEYISNVGTQTDDVVMMQIEELIRNKYQEACAHISKINDDFRNSILKSLLEVNTLDNAEEFVRKLINSPETISSITQTQQSYMQLLESLNVLTKDEAEEYSSFFDYYRNDVQNFKNDKNTTLTVGFVLRFQEFIKIRTLIPLAENMEGRKTQAMRMIELFQNTMNEFIGSTIDDKKICINETGHIFFTTKYSEQHIPISKLSSGEKQLLTFFANLIFNVDRKSSGIFVVDEPELSLHLSWQKIFVDKAININNNIQLIFATHAPEIIGRYRDKMFRLEKSISQQKVEM